MKAAMPAPREVAPSDVSRLITRMSQIPTAAALSAAVVLGILLCDPTPVEAQGRGGSALDADISLIETEVLGLERRVASLRSDVSSGSLTRSPRLIGERFAEAKYAYAVEDYERCALIFFSLLENDDLRGDPRRNEGQWYLAECLFLDGNLSPAQDQFQRIVDSGASHPFYSDSLLKLIELFGRTGNIDRFNEYYNRFVRQSMDTSPTSLRIRYQMGKTLFNQGKLTDAQAIFAAFPRGSRFTPQARYFSGVILVAEGRIAAEAGDELLPRQKYEQAIVSFREVLTLPVSEPDHKRVVDLCHMALGRLSYELGDIPGAIGEYTRVQANSDYYDDALYEMIWANIEAASQITTGQTLTEGQVATMGTTIERARKYEEALRAIEIFNLAYPDDSRNSTLKLLAGHVRVRQEQFEEAVDKYEGAATYFRELKLEVDAIVGSGADPMVYFNQLVDHDFVAEADLTVPRSARLQAQSDDQVAQAVQVSGDLYRQQQAIDDATDILDLLEEALYQEDSQGLIQTYRINRQQLSSTEAAGLMLRSRLVETEMAWLEANLTGSARRDLEAVEAEMSSAQGAAVAIAQQRQDVVGKQDAFNLQGQAVKTRVYHIELAVKDLLGRLTAVEEYLVDARNRGERSREQEVEAREQIEAERARLNTMLESLHDLKKRLEPRVLTARLGSVQAQDAGGQRTDARSRLASIEGRLSALRRSASGGSDFFRRLDGSRSRLIDLERLAAETRDMMDRAEAAEVDDIIQEVRFQRRMVGSLDAEGGAISQTNRGISGRIGRQAFVDVAAFYEDMLTRADMGVADVYWYRKETTSKDREELAREKVRRLKALEEAFSSVLGD